MITTEKQELGVPELKTRLVRLNDEDRREILTFLTKLEAEGANESEQSSAEPAAPPRMNLQEAKAYLFRNCDSLLERLAQ